MERVLLIRLTALGDVVLVRPTVEALKAAFEGVRVELVTEARYAAFASAHLGVDRVVPYDRHGEDAGLEGVRRVHARLQGHYDLVADLQGKLRTRMLAQLVSADRHLVLRKRTFGRAVLAALGHDPPLVRRRAAALYLDVFAELGLSRDAPEVRLVPPPGSPPQALEIGLSVGASHATKRWSPERFSALGRALLRARPEARLVLVGGPGDAATLDAVAEGLEGLAVEDTRALDVPGLARRIAGLDLVVSVDSGPAHLAAGFGVPTVVIFGPTSSARWGPVGSAHAVVELGLDCAPCSNTGSARCPRPERDHACLRALEVEPVLEASLAALSRAGR